MWEADFLSQRQQAIVDVADAEVILDVVQSVSERVAVCARLCNRLRNAPDYRRDNEDPKQVVDSHEDTLELRNRVIHLANSEEQHRRPVHAKEVVICEI